MSVRSSPPCFLLRASISAALLALLSHSGFAQCRYTEQQIVVPAQRSVNDRFGSSITMQGDLAVLGAFLDDEVDQEAGAAYLYHWNEGQKLVASDGSRGNEFGTSVAVQAGRIAVGAWGASHAGQGGGAVYVFEHDGTRWNEVQKLIGSQRKGFDQFGMKLDLDGDAMVIGANEGAEGGAAQGKAYVFRSRAGTWVEEQLLRASDGEDRDIFGTDVTIQDDMVVVGAPHDHDAGSFTLTAHYHEPGLSGLEVLFQSFGQTPGGNLEASDAEPVLLR